MVPARIEQAMTRSGSAKNRLRGTAYNTFGLILVASIKRIILSSQRLSPLCFVGTKKLLYATSIYQMFRQIVMIKLTHLYSRGIQPFERVDGLPVVGHFKNWLLRNQLSSFARIA